MKNINWSLSIRQVKAARALVGWSQENLSAYSGVSIPTVRRLEAEDGQLGGRAETVQKIRQALEKAGVVFLSDGEAVEAGGAGVRLRDKSS